MYNLTDYDYYLPEGLIAQMPVSQRGASRLLHLNRTSGQLSHFQFSDITDLLNKGDVLVVNNTAVIPARLFGRKETGGKIEILIINYAAPANTELSDKKVKYECLVRASKAPKAGTRIDFGPDLNAIVTAVHDRTCTLNFSLKNPLPRCLKKTASCRCRPISGGKTPATRNSTTKPVIRPSTPVTKVPWQPPTAGLHFSEGILGHLKAKGIIIAGITLHVGYGTFMPIRCTDIRNHEMHSEYFIIPERSADMINAAKAEGRRVVAVGTTSVRTLEYVSDKKAASALRRQL